MDLTLFPTKGNLMQAKNTLRLSAQGYELLDKKRNILVQEMMSLIDEAKTVQTEIEAAFAEAYRLLQAANIVHGISDVQRIARAIPPAEQITVRHRSVMGVELPIARSEAEKETHHPYGLFDSSSTLDEAKQGFDRVRELTIRLATIENCIYRLAVSISKTQKRANALKNITIPRYQAIVQDISNALEEKEREEFSRLKVIKKR